MALSSLDTTPKSASMRSAESWATAITGIPYFKEDKSRYWVDMINAIQADALASAKTDGVAVVRQLRDALESAGGTFRWYQQLHAAKPDMEKAKRNAEFAEKCETQVAAATAFLTENGG